MAELIAPTTAVATSADFTLSSPRTLNLKTGSTSIVLPQYASVSVQIKSGAEYVTVGALTGANPVRVLDAAGTFRLLKDASSVVVGVDGS